MQQRHCEFTACTACKGMGMELNLEVHRHKAPLLRSGMSSKVLSVELACKDVC